MSDAQHNAAAMRDPDAKPPTPADFKRMKRTPQVKVGAPKCISSRILFSAIVYSLASSGQPRLSLPMKYASLLPE
jgi:hypothetical protein